MDATDAGAEEGDATASPDGTLDASDGAVDAHVDSLGDAAHDDTSVDAAPDAKPDAPTTAEWLVQNSGGILWHVCADSLGNVIGVGNGGTGGDHAIITKVDQNGFVVWRNVGNGGGWEFADVATDAAGNVLVAGTTRSPTDFGAGPLSGAFALKLSPSGSVIWQRSFGVVADVLAVAERSGHIVFAGTLTQSADFGGGMLSLNGSSDALIVELASDGSFVRSQAFGSVEDQWISDIATDASGELIAVGAFYGQIDFGGGALVGNTPPSSGRDGFGVRLDAVGGHLASKKLAINAASMTTSAGTERDMALTANGITVVGDLEGTVDFGGGPLVSAGSVDIFVVNLDSDFNHVWSMRFGDSAPQYGYSVVTDASGDFAIGGVMGGTVDFGQGAITAPPNAFAYVSRFDSARTNLGTRLLAGSNVYVFDLAGLVGSDVTAVGRFDSITFNGTFLTTSDPPGGYLARLSF